MVASMTAADAFSTFRPFSVSWRLISSSNSDKVLSGTKPVLIVEGMSVGFLPKELFDKTICFYTDEETELKRRLARDTTVRNRDASFILASHQMRREQYLHYYKETESRADILVKQSEDKFEVKRT